MTPLTERLLKIIDDQSSTIEQLVSTITKLTGSEKQQQSSLSEANLKPIKGKDSWNEVKYKLENLTRNKSEEYWKNMAQKEAELIKKGVNNESNEYSRWTASSEATGEGNSEEEKIG